MAQVPVEDPKPTEAPRILREEARFYARKVIALRYVIGAVYVFLLAGFWELQIRRPDYYAEAATRNQIKSTPVLAPRGKILDRDGRVIVDNKSSFSLLLSRETLKQEHLKPIADGLGIDYEELQAKLKRFDRTRPKYEPIVIKEELSPADLAFVASHRDHETFPEMELIESHVRYYPQDGLAAHITGYVGEISDNELNLSEYASSRAGDVVGKAGVEKHFNELLTGIDGQRQVEVDNRGNERQVLQIKPAQPGQVLQLTIDLDLQVVAEMAMEGRQGAVVALDPRNGEVLAMVSRPAYDPNKFVGRIKTSDWKEIMSDPDKPLINRAIQAQLAPGSTFKPIMALAGLETEAIDMDYSVTCGGGAYWYGRPFKCHLRRGHGTVRLNRALAGSCDVFFYSVGNKLGIDRIAQYAEMAGLGKKTGIDLPHEAEGLVPSSKWKIRTQRQKWYAGETISVSIGQGALILTPLQLAHAIGGIAAGGVWHKPHLNKDNAQHEAARRADLKIDNLLNVINGMYSVVNEGGTAGIARLPGIDVCGKTGTSQLASNDFVKALRSNPERNADMFKDNAWFVGFAGRQTPEIVVAALFEHGEHGNLAAPIVRDVIKAYYDKKARQQQDKKVLARTLFLKPEMP